MTSETTLHFITGLVLASTLSLLPAGCAQTLDTEAQSEPLIRGARWHHVHINTTDSAAAEAYYSAHFNAAPEPFPGVDASVKSGDAWVFFNQVERAAPTDLVTPIWHIGWGAPDPQAEFEKQKALGNNITVPLTELVGGVTRYKPGEFYYMYVESPDGTLIELNTAATDEFGHIHMYASDPFATGAWYGRYFGVRPETESAAPSSDGSPPAFPRRSLNFDQVNMIIYPERFARSLAKNGLGGLQRTTGYVNDHIGVEVADLSAALKTFREEGVEILETESELGNGVQHAFILGPDNMVIELLELEN